MEWPGRSTRERLLDNRRAALISASAVWCVPMCGDELVRVGLRPDIVRDTGGVIRFDRDQFVTIHEGPDSRNRTPVNDRFFREEIDVRYDRNGGLICWQATRVPADPANPDMPRGDAVRRLKPSMRGRGRAAVPPTRDAGLRQTVLWTHLELMHGIPGNGHTSCGPQTFEATAEFTARFLRSYFTDASRPWYLKAFNEPFVKAKRIGTTIEALARQHVAVARCVHELCPDVPIARRPESRSGPHTAYRSRRCGCFSTASPLIPPTTGPPPTNEAARTTSGLVGVPARADSVRPSSVVEVTYTNGNARPLR